MTHDVQSAFDDLVDHLEDWLEKHGDTLGLSSADDEQTRLADELFEREFDIADNE